MGVLAASRAGGFPQHAVVVPRKVPVPVIKVMQAVVEDRMELIDCAGKTEYDHAE
jgi:hypothetical protein